ncbi:MAG: hypothetical protein LC539_10355 [Candidatus Thiodiazotropha sp.]|nr:hypothetical protein [Candidatus Thiodiazotropha sp.]MCM8922108.1 hypothetical protein [Candidatus Thiodiazotropha sp.]
MFADYIIQATKWVGSATVCLLATRDCIAAGHNLSQVNSDRQVLPFAGDSRMSVILSKARLLAEETKI